MTMQLNTQSPEATCEIFNLLNTGQVTTIPMPRRKVYFVVPVIIDGDHVHVATRDENAVYDALTFTPA